MKTEKLVVSKKKLLEDVKENRSKDSIDSFHPVVCFYLRFERRPDADQKRAASTFWEPIISKPSLFS